MSTTSFSNIQLQSVIFSLWVYCRLIFFWRFLHTISFHQFFYFYSLHWSITSSYVICWRKHTFSWMFLVVFMLVMILVEYIERKSQAESIERRIMAGVSDVQRQPVYPPANYCRYCDIQCNSPTQYAQHCTSKDHVFRVTTDQDHEWKFRPPPAGGQFELCLE